MKKIIAKFLNAMKERKAKKRQTNKIEVGEVYFVTHAYKKDFYIKVSSFNDAWVEGIAVNSETVTDGEEIIVLRKLCKFTKLNSE